MGDVPVSESILLSSTSSLTYLAFTLMTSFDSREGLKESVASSSLSLLLFSTWLLCYGLLESQEKSAKLSFSGRS